MSVDPLMDILRTALDAATAAGATDADASLSIADRFGCEARLDAVTKLERSRARGLALRVFRGKKRASLSTTDLTPDGIRALAARVVEAASFVGDDPHAGLPEAFGSAGEDLGLVSPDVAARDDEAKVEEALALERRVRELDPRITNSKGAHVNDTRAQHLLANTRGFAGSYATTSASRSVQPLASDGADRRIGYYGTAARSYAGLTTAEDVARLGVERAVQLCGARKPQTMRVPVIFERDLAGSVIGDLFQALSAANVASGNSFLDDRIGERIGSEHVTIVDDGLLYGGLGTSPFDSEGVPTRTTVVFDRGVLKTYLADTYNGRRIGMASTGNAAGGGVGPNNFVLRAGSGSLDDLIRSTKRGVLVVDTIGFATEHASGTYSRGARGMMIENGELAYPIDEFTIASTFPEMLAGIDAVADDLVYDGSIVAPSFRVAEMQISGN